MLSFTLLLCTLLASSSAFQGSPLSFQQLKLKKQEGIKFPSSLTRSNRATTTAVGVGWTMENSDDIDYLLNKARECAYSDDDDKEYSVQDAFQMLQDLTFLLSDCRYGNLGTQNAVCEQQDEAAEVVARLRVKASSSSTATATAEALAVSVDVAVAVDAKEESAWKSAVWTVLTKLEIPMAIVFYFTCLFCIVHFGEFGVNQVDIGETSSKVNEYYVSANTDLPPTFFHRGVF